MIKGTEKIIVKVNANFDRGSALFDWLKKFGQKHDNSFVFWNEYAFTTDDIPGSDALLVFNNPSEEIHITSDPDKSLAFMMEPGVSQEHPWMFKGLNQYKKVYSPLNNSANTILSHGYLGWYFQHNWQFLSQLPVPEKTKSMSCIASGQKQLKGHRLRTGFVEMLRKQKPEIDFFGKGSNYLPDKLDGLLPYRFSIAIENTSAPYYFTEKINDCFLAYTVPLYYGCKNIGKYFPEKSFINIDITEHGKAIRKIEEAIENNDWHERLNALQEARELVLNKYQPLAGAAAIFRETESSGSKQKIEIDPINATMLRRIKDVIVKARNKKQQL
ncbi:MAG: glycosyltransferase family 10 [Bacteroidota bacterium]